MTRTLPHDHYAAAVRNALGALHDAAESWTAYDSDDGEVMLMEILISFDPDTARESGWDHGLILLWDQTVGWRWAYGTRERGRNSVPELLLVGPLVADPDDVLQAVRILLTYGPEQLPAQAAKPQRPLLHATLTPELEKALGGDGGDADLTREEAEALAAYAET